MNAIFSLAPSLLSSAWDCKRPLYRHVEDGDESEIGPEDSSERLLSLLFDLLRTSSMLRKGALFAEVL